ncbi:MAG: type II toxin-antitoxin system death-on-curing family toxin [Anaerolineae bacterium]|nr:type II toxin-antitoxin system death-on-curing family toxin [Anaerolineae bacterium]
MPVQIADMRYPTYSEIIFINGRILNNPEIQSGKKKIRDIDLLLAAAQRPQASAFGQDAYRTLKEKAAVLVHAIARNHPFADGNKRTATIGALFLLHINGEKVLWKPQAALDRILNVAEGRTAPESFAAWLQTASTGEAALEPDSVQDRHIIDTLIAEQKWLLDELAKR